MANYKGLTFRNTLNDFKRWCKEFAPLERGTDEVFYEEGDYYLSIEKVKGFLGSGGSFAGVTLRKYDEKEKDFIYCNDEEAQKLFKDKVERYKEKHNLTIGGF